MIDFRFRLKNCPPINQFINNLEKATQNGPLKGLYNLHDNDRGPEVHNCTPFSAVLIKENIKQTNNQIYLSSYFDNENSANRYYDLVNYISEKFKRYNFYMDYFTTVNYHYVRPIKNSRYPNLKGLEIKEFINQIKYLKKI